MPRFPIIDAHVHLYDPAAVRYSWMDDAPALNSRHGLAEFTEAVAPVTVDGLVFVEVAADDGRHLDEAHWVEKHGHGNSMLRGLVGSLPLENGAAVLADLDCFSVLPHARGIRRLIQDRPAGWALQPGFIEGVQHLAKLDLPFDLCIRHHQLGEAIELVKRCPDTRFVLDHIGKPAIREGLTEPWRSQVRELSRIPTVFCKISGVATEADHAAWTFEQVAPYIAHAIESFGFPRLMFGGDWPVSRAATAYARWIETLDRVVAGVSEQDLHRLYRNTAIDFYRL